MAEDAAAEPEPEPAEEPSAEEPAADGDEEAPVNPESSPKMDKTPPGSDAGDEQDGGDADEENAGGDDKAAKKAEAEAAKAAKKAEAEAAKAAKKADAEAAKAEKEAAKAAVRIPRCCCCARCASARCAAANSDGAFLRCTPLPRRAKAASSCY